MYLLEFSRTDCPGCDGKWFFETIEEIETFINDEIVENYTDPPKFYADGLWIYEIIGRNPTLLMRSMYDVMEDAEWTGDGWLMPECKSPKVETVAKLIYDLHCLSVYVEF